jgi:modulator of FtsH protease
MNDVAPWSNFLIAEVGATAALTGLIIVAVSINLQHILSFPQLPGRAAEMLIMLVGALLVCSFGLMPGQSVKLLGSEIVAVGLLMTVAPIVIQARQLPILKTQPLTWWLWRLIVALCAAVPVLTGGLYLVTGTGHGLYWVAAGVLVTLAATVWSAWVLLIEILR